MATSIYVGNLPWSITEEELGDLFAAHGPVLSVKIITDRDTGRSRGFAFVEMEKEHAQEAISSIDGTSLGGRNLKVNEAQPKPQRQNRW
jgi:RNA recognition motif-containing protein